MSADPASAAGAPSALDEGTYEVLRDRLHSQASELARRSEELNDRRVAEFGGIDWHLLDTVRFRTENACVARDLVALPDNRVLFGYDVFLGMKPQPDIADVLAVRQMRRAESGFEFEPATIPGLLDAERFTRDFTELHRYHKNTRLLQQRRLDDRLLAIFQVGERTEDTKVLRWLIDPDGTCEYVDNRGDSDHRFPPLHDFEWVETTRENHVPGRHPHLSILGTVFVETIGGTLTVKVENNTTTGAGIYSEPVDEPLQSLADADVFYAKVGALILLKIRPYNETTWRYLVFNTRTSSVVRLDGIGSACRLLPDDQGIIFPGGYYLATGVHKTFDIPIEDLEYERTIFAANGEDVLYVFHARAAGRTLLLPYNMIREHVSTVLSCNGYALFDDGTLVILRGGAEEPARVHPLQIWQTPFVSDAHAAQQPSHGGPLARIGNPELVRGIADCLAVTRMVDDMAPAAAVFESLIAACTRTVDEHHWLAEPDVGALTETMTALRATAEQVLAEFEKVSTRTAAAAAQLDEVADQVGSLLRTGRAAAHTTADGWITLLTELHRAQGRLATLREVRYIDTNRVTELAEAVAQTTADIGTRAVRFLSAEDAFAGYHTGIAATVERAEGIATVAEAAEIRADIAEQTSGLHTVTEVIGTLDIADVTVRTLILERVGAVLAALNRANATLTARRDELAGAEARAEFAAEYTLLGQTVAAGLAVADTPEGCDDQLAKAMSAIETLEARFGEFDDFAERLAAERDDIYATFATRRQALIDERSRRATRLADSAHRVLASIERRCATLNSTDDINTFFAGDPLVARLRTVVTELRDLNDVVRAEELDGRLAAARQEAGRSLRDRGDMFDADGLRLGKHRFAVNTQRMELAMVPGEHGMDFIIAGTGYRAPVEDPDFAATETFWDQAIVSETRETYRSEYLAARILDDAENRGTVAGLQAIALADGDVAGLVTTAAEQRYDEGYERGVHDRDAAAILAALLRLRAGAGLLRYRAVDRAAAQLWWCAAPELDENTRRTWRTRISSLTRAAEAFRAGGPDEAEEGAATLSAGQPGAAPTAADRVRAELADGIAELVTAVDLMAVDAAAAADYLFAELGVSGTVEFTTARSARTLLDRFHRRLTSTRSRTDYARTHGELTELAQRYHLVAAWLTAFRAGDDAAASEDPDGDLAEAVAIELCGTEVARRDSAAERSATVTGLLGVHPRITDRTLRVRIEELLHRTRRHHRERVPGFQDYLRRRNALVAAEIDRLRLNEFRPTVPRGFVRNRLLNEVYLPLIGDNLAKQLGSTAEHRRIDQSGLLMLISPPGYGKTTLVEYVAARLGLVLVKVNGPALGHAVRSIDPADAPDGAARQEVEKINFALELGNNVLLYLDDIQHTSPELLQKFISLCDGQRKMEGMWAGRSRTYDLRGKRFAVCMSGNPYTEQGRRFQIPDMLANRADVWNLGDVLSGRDELFALSYLENALTANPVLAQLAGRDGSDVELLVRIASGDDAARPDQLTHPYSAAELADIVAVLAKMLQVRDVVLQVNQAYIASAAMADGSRTTPPFQLQGSYRNMNSLTAQIVPVMNDAELAALIDDHYAGEAQTLAGGAEANLLALGALRGTLTPEQTTRWAQVRSAYQRDQALGGSEDDPLVRAIAGFGLLADRLGAVESAIRTLESSPPSGSHAVSNGGQAPVFGD